jgi:hypothetical protein
MDLFARVCPDPEFQYKTESAQEEQYLRLLRQHRAQLEQLSSAVLLRAEQHAALQKELAGANSELARAQAELKDRAHALQLVESRSKKQAREIDCLKAELRTCGARMQTLDSEQSRELAKYKELLLTAEQGLSCLKVENNSKACSMENLARLYEERGRKLIELENWLKETLPQLGQREVEVDTLNRHLFERSQRGDELARELVQLKEAHCKAQQTNKQLEA